MALLRLVFIFLKKIVILFTTAIWKSYIYGYAQYKV
jgi:hypothetical protein